MDKDQAQAKLSEMIQSLDGMPPNMKGKTNLKRMLIASLKFIQQYQIDEKTIRLIIEEREKNYKDIV